MGCLVKELMKYLEPKPKNEEKEYEIKESFENLGNSENLKLKNNKRNLQTNKKLIEKEKLLNEREKKIEKDEKKYLDDMAIFEREKKNYEEQIENNKKLYEEINLEKTNLIKFKSENEEKVKELQNRKNELNIREEELQKMEKELQEKGDKLKEKEGEILNKENELLSNTNIFNNNSNELNKKKQELIDKEKELNKKEEELNEQLKLLKQQNEPILIGLNNIGATCYMNASLQCFSNTKKLSEYFLKHYIKEPNKIMSNEYYEVLKNLWDRENNNKSYSPNSFKDVLSKENPLFAGIAANDSKDLINFLLERFHQELNLAKNENNNNDPNSNLNPQDQSDEQLMLKLFLDEMKEKFDSPISNLFYGILETKSQCQGCNIIKYNFQVYSFLEFPLQQVNQFFFNKGTRPLVNPDGKNPDVDLYECFEYYEKVDLMTGDNQMFCNQCNKLCNSFYSTKLYSGPTYLILNLNRGKGAVYECKVNFPEQLTIINYLTNKDGITTYELYAVICHLGPSSMSGHFVAYCRNRIDNKWYLYNDALVSLCTKPKQYTDGMPYILFYKALRAGQNSDI